MKHNLVARRIEDQQGVAFSGQAPTTRLESETVARRPQPEGSHHHSVSEVPFVNVIGAKIAKISREEAAEKIVALAHNRERKYICVASAHSILEGYDDPRQLQILNNAFMTVADGVSLIAAMKLLGNWNLHRSSGTELVHEICRRGKREGIKVGFYGASPECVELLCEKLKEQYPNLEIVYAVSPPYRELSVEEKRAALTEMNDSGAHIMFIGLGNPKQELWIDEHYQHCDSVLIGVGAAFDFISGTKKRAPYIMRRMGLEWLHRLVLEPKRMWRRNFIHNPRYVGLLLLQLTGLKKFKV